MLAQQDILQIKDIVRETLYQDKDALRLQQQQWRKFKDSPEARLASLEIRVEDFIAESRINFEKIEQQNNRIDKKIDAIDEKFDRKFDAIDEKFDRKFDKVNDALLNIHEMITAQYKMINAQVWKFLAGISALAIILKLIDKLL